MRIVLGVSDRSLCPQRLKWTGEARAFRREWFDFPKRNLGFWIDHDMAFNQFRAFQRSDYNHLIIRLCHRRQLSPQMGWEFDEGAIVQQESIHFPAWI